jgi:hypothetical protein
MMLQKFHICKRDGRIYATVWEDESLSCADVMQKFLKHDGDTSMYAKCVLDARKGGTTDEKI